MISFLVILLSHHNDFSWNGRNWEWVADCWKTDCAVCCISFQMDRFSLLVFWDTQLIVITTFVLDHFVFVLDQILYRIILILFCCVSSCLLYTLLFRNVLWFIVVFCWWFYFFLNFIVLSDWWWNSFGFFCLFLFNLVYRNPFQWTIVFQILWSIKFTQPLFLFPFLSLFIKISLSFHQLLLLLMQSYFILISCSWKLICQIDKISREHNSF